MDRNKEQEEPRGRHEHPLRSEIGEEAREQTASAHDEAEKDIEADPEFSASSPNDDLDEGETARLGDDGAGII